MTTYDALPRWPLAVLPTPLVARAEARRAARARPLDQARRPHRVRHRRQQGPGPRAADRRRPPCGLRSRRRLRRPVVQPLCRPGPGRGHRRAALHARPLRRRHRDRPPQSDRRRAPPARRSSTPATPTGRRSSPGRPRWRPTSGPAALGPMSSPAAGPRPWARPDSPSPPPSSPPSGRRRGPGSCIAARIGGQRRRAAGRDGRRGRRPDRRRRRGEPADRRDPAPDRSTWPRRAPTSSVDPIPRETARRGRRLRRPRVRRRRSRRRPGRRSGPAHRGAPPRRHLHGQGGRPVVTAAGPGRRPDDLLAHRGLGRRPRRAGRQRRAVRGRPCLLRSVTPPDRPTSSSRAGSPSSRPMPRCSTTGSTWPTWRMSSISGRASCCPTPAAVALISALLDIDAVPADEFPYDPRHGETYNSRERVLVERLGDTAGWLARRPAATRGDEGRLPAVPPPRDLGAGRRRRRSRNRPGRPGAAPRRCPVPRPDLSAAGPAVDGRALPPGVRLPAAP